MNRSITFTLPVHCDKYVVCQHHCTCTLIETLSVGTTALCKWSPTCRVISTSAFRSLIESMPACDLVHSGAQSPYPESHRQKRQKQSIKRKSARRMSPSSVMHRAWVHRPASNSRVAGSAPGRGARSCPPLPERGTSAPPFPSERKFYENVTQTNIPLFRGFSTHLVLKRGTLALPSRSSILVRPWMIACFSPGMPVYSSHALDVELSSNV